MYHKYNQAEIKLRTEAKKPPAKLLELISEEHVGEVDLPNDVGKVEQLASKELEEVSSSLCLLLVPIPAI